MLTVRLDSVNDLEDWRHTARRLLLARQPPDSVKWHAPGEAAGLFETDELPPLQQQVPAVATVAPAFIDLARLAICHADAERFDLLYRLLWRLQENRALLDIRSDPDVRRLETMARVVRRDAHKMKAFVRFKSIAAADGVERYAAWFEPSHYTLEGTAPFFVRRFAGMSWAIVTPYRTALWDGSELAFGDGGRKSDVPADDALEEIWRTYFSSIFNPARLKVAMMKSEMPVKYWRNLPEAALIPSLIKDARRREEEMILKATTEPPTRHRRHAQRHAVPERHGAAEIASLAAAGAAIADCRRCSLCEHATQAVFGEGPPTADVMFVGEQPGDQEDLAGRPFVGPAGKVFDAALGKVGIDRGRTYVTNAVKHFKFAPRGKRRLHQKPNGGEIAACRFWLELERELVKPRLIVALGATAVQSVLGRPTTLSSIRGRRIALADGTLFFATVHPSHLLRIPNPDERAREARAFESDLARIRTIMDEERQAA